MHPPRPEPESQAFALVRRFGTASTAFQTLSPAFTFWHLDKDAGLAYVDTGRAWVCAGPPLCVVARQREVAQAFVQAAAAASRRVVFFGAPADLLPDEAGRFVTVGQEPLYDPKAWPKHRQHSASMRQQLQRARNKGLVVRKIAHSEFVDLKSPKRQQVEALMARWSAAHAMPPMGFLVDLNPFFAAHARHFWLAEMPQAQQGPARIVGFAVLIPVTANNGYMLEHLLRDPDAPNGTAECLVDAVLGFARDADVLSLGIIPLYHVTHPVLRAALWAGEGLYHFGGLGRFKAKLAPSRWNDVFVTWPKSAWLITTLYDVLCAFAPQGLVRFGMGILGRGSRFLLRLLAWVLLPWTAALASMEGDVWFPDKALQHFWTGFDVLLAAGLFWLSHTWRRSLATWLATLVTCDAVLTCVEVCLYPGPKGLGAGVVRALAVAAPTATAVVLWNARAYRARYRLKGQLGRLDKM